MRPGGGPGIPWAVRYDLGTRLWCRKRRRASALETGRIFSRPGNWLLRPHWRLPIFTHDAGTDILGQGDSAGLDFELGKLWPGRGHHGRREAAGTRSAERREAGRKRGEEAGRGKRQEEQEE